MKPPNLALTKKIGGVPTAWKCPACSEPFELSQYHGTKAEEFAALLGAACTPAYSKRALLWTTNQMCPRIGAPYEPEITLPARGRKPCGFDTTQCLAICAVSLNHIADVTR